MPQRFSLPTLLILLSLAVAARSEMPPASNQSLDQQDVMAWLEPLLKQEPTLARVKLLPAHGNVIILTGAVNQGDDIQRAMKLARCCGARQVINALRVGSVEMVQIDIVLVQVARSELRRMAPGLFEQWQGFVPPSETHASFQTVNSERREELVAFLQELREQELVKLLAEPHLVAISGRPACFNSGGQQAVPKLDAAGQVIGETYVEFGTSLDTLPTVLADGRINLEVGVSVITLDSAAGVAVPGWGLIPGRLQQSFRTSANLVDGETAIIGGLISSNVRQATERFPVLGDLPFVGSYFSKTEWNEVEEESLLLVTAHIVKE